MAVYVIKRQARLDWYECFMRSPRVLFRIDYSGRLRRGYAGRAVEAAASAVDFMVR